MSIPDVVEVLIPTGPPGPPGPAGAQGPPGQEGASTLTELTDVTGAGGYGTSPVDDGTSTFPLTRVTTQEDLDAILQAVAAVNWRPLELAPGFTNWGGDYAPARYRLTLNNVVHIEGLVQYETPLTTADAGTPITQLPADSLPGGRLIFTAACDDSRIARLDINADGTLSFEGFLGTAGAPPATTAPANAVQSLEGGAVLVGQVGTPDPTWEVELTSYSDSYGACEWTIPAVLTPATVARLQLDYTILEGGIGGGSPRLSLGIDGSAVHVLLGTPPNYDDPTGDWQTTGNLADPANPDGRFDLSQYGGPQVATWQDLLDRLGDQRITSLFGVADGGWLFTGPQGQVIRFRNLRVDPVAVPANYLSLSAVNYSVGGPNTAVATAALATRFT